MKLATRITLVLALGLMLASCAEEAIVIHEAITIINLDGDEGFDDVWIDDIDVPFWDDDYILCEEGDVDCVYDQCLEAGNDPEFCDWMVKDIFGDVVEPTEHRADSEPPGYDDEKEETTQE